MELGSMMEGTHYEPPEDALSTESLRDVLGVRGFYFWGGTPDYESRELEA